MQQSTKEIGDLGEERALLFLQEKGYEIIHTNWRKKHLEIDIICKEENTFVFVEVKTRRKAELISPHEVFSKKKQQNLIHIASLYLSEYNLWEEPSRFDLLCIHKNNLLEKIEHWKNVIITRNIMGSGYTTW
ncbi:MAG: YraN family protein [Desulfovibrionaceae bacterium]